MKMTTGASFDDDAAPERIVNASQCPFAFAFAVGAAVQPAL